MTDFRRIIRIKSMKNKPLPIEIDPYQLAKSATTLSGSLKIRSMERLKALLLDEHQAVNAVLQFGKDEEGYYFVRVDLQAELILQCQRCLEPMNYNLQLKVNLCLLNDEKKIKNIPEHYEPLLVNSNSMKLADIVEDELLLNIPLVAKHDNKECSPSLSKLNAQANKMDFENKPKPFAVLAKLKKDK